MLLSKKTYHIGYRCSQTVIKFFKSSILYSTSPSDGLLGLIMELVLMLQQNLYSRLEMGIKKVLS